ncbi:MAG: hypothetical protein HYV63_23545 [Candidatus Schekmanbacteria bacterium]|nr:hypothetical protein [Candidatus Schekmanbacteria bacterium]
MSMLPLFSASEDAAAFIRRIVREETGVNLGPDKQYLIDTRLQPILRQYGLASHGDLVGKLRNGAARDVLRRAVIEALLTPETSFFRDRHVFSYLENLLLPSVIASRAAERQLRIWSAASSSGQEIYSLAMLLAEKFPQLRGWTVSLLATDVSERILAYARAGCYTRFEAQRGLTEEQRRKYLMERDGDFQVRKDLRQLVDFRILNLTAKWPPLPPMDIILLRNVLIYFNDETRRDIFAQAACALRRDGVLILGASETIVRSEFGFRPRLGTAPGVYERTDG